MNTSLLHLLSRNWWLLLLRGLVAIAFGILAFAWPGLTLMTLVIMYGVFAALDGICALAAAIRGGSVAPRWWLVVAGLLGLGAAAAAIFYPGMTALILLMFIGGWAIARGIIEIAGALRLRKEIDNEWWLVLSGILSVLFGLFVLIRPGAGALALVWVIGTWAIILGIILIALSLRLRKHGKAAETVGAPA